MAMFVLVHGGAHGGSCWDKLVPELLPSYLDDLAGIEARRAELDAQIKVTTNEDESADDEREES